MNNKYVQNCRFVHHAKFQCIMTTLKRLFKIEFEKGGTGKEPKIFRVGRPKIDFLKSIKGGTLWVGRESNP